MGSYLKRVADDLLRFKLETKGAVLVEGAKWCGKTTTARQAAKSVLYVSDPKNLEQNLLLAKLEPDRLLMGESPRLLDEWQLAPSLWDAVRFEVDQRGRMGQFILTGSAVPADRDKIFHSGVGRITRLRMRPMSLFESGESTGEVSLKSLFGGDDFGAVKNDYYKLEDLGFVACRGGWPGAIGLEGKYALAQAIDYTEATIEDDISRVDNIRRDVEKTRKIMRSYARNQGSQASLETIVTDVTSNESVDISRNTVISYLEALKKLFVIEDGVAWSPNLRSKTAIRTSDTRYFVDPSIATAVLGLNPDSLIRNLNLFGFIFETLCVRDLRVYAEAMDAKIYHYRDKRGLECDAVVVLRDGRYGLVEIKLGGDGAIAEAAKTLEDFTGDLVNEPEFRMILTGTSQYAYKRDDGILVVPVGCLGP